MVILTLVTGVSIAMSMVFFLGLLLPDISEDLGLSPSQQGWLASSALITNLILVIPINTWTSRFRPRRLISLAFLGVSGAVFLQARAPIFAVLVLGRVMLALSTIFTQAPRVLIIQQWSSRRQLPLTHGILIGGVDFMFGVTSFLTPFIIMWVGGWRNALSVWGLFCLLVAGTWIALGRERVTEEFKRRIVSQEKTPLASIFRYRELWFGAFGLFGVLVGESSFALFWPTYAESQLHVSSTIVGVALGLTAFAATPGSVWANVIPVLVQHRGLVLAACGLVKFGATLGLLQFEATSQILVLAVVKGLFSAYFSIFMIMVFYLPDIKPREVAVGQAFLRIAIFSGAALGPLLVGFLQEATGDLRQALLVTAFFPLALVATAFLIRGSTPGAMREARTS